MVKIAIYGYENDQSKNGGFANELPWYSRTWFSCPRCGTVFQLQEQDFIQNTNLPVGGNSGTPWYLAWRKFNMVSGSGTEVPNEFDPDFVEGICFNCGVPFLKFTGPHYLQAHDNPANIVPQPYILYTPPSGQPNLSQVRLCIYKDVYDIEYMAALYMYADGSAIRSATIPDSVYGMYQLRDTDKILWHRYAYQQAINPIPAERYLTEQEGRIWDWFFCYILDVNGVSIAE
jgi:hypothetical protein